ncbi:MAG: hypothetical protein ACJ761_11170 [Chloroflexota bacterium]
MGYQRSLLAEYNLRLQHRHGDGSWGEFKPARDHAPSQHDPERQWSKGTIYACAQCQEEMLVVHDREQPTPVE